LNYTRDGRHRTQLSEGQQAGQCPDGYDQANRDQPPGAAGAQLAVHILGPRSAPILDEGKGVTGEKGSPYRQHQLGKQFVYVEDVDRGVLSRQSSARLETEYSCTYPRSALSFVALPSSECAPVMF